MVFSHSKDGFLVVGYLVVDVVLEINSRHLSLIAMLLQVFNLSVCILEVHGQSFVLFALLFESVFKVNVSPSAIFVLSCHVLDCCLVIGVFS